MRHCPITTRFRGGVSFPYIHVHTIRGLIVGLALSLPTLASLPNMNHTVYIFQNFEVMFVHIEKAVWYLARNIYNPEANDARAEWILERG